MPVTIGIKYNALLTWRPSLFGQFLMSILLSLLPLLLVVILFLNALNEQLATTQTIIDSNYKVTKSFNNLKQDLNTIERATRQNWVLKSESLDGLIIDKWIRSFETIDELIVLGNEYDKQKWQTFSTVLHNTKRQLIDKNMQNATLFIPISLLLNEKALWLREKNEQKIAENQQQLEMLQRSFINWLVALLPLTMLVGGGFLLRISGHLKGLTTVIDKLGEGHWQQTISVKGSAELVELGNKLQWVQAQLHTLEQQKDTFLRHVTHELKTPLASMVEGTDLLSDEIVGPINKEQQAVLVLITQGMDRLSNMIDSLLSYNTIRTSKNNLTKVEFELIKRKINDHFNYRLQSRNQTLCWHVSVPDVSLPLAGELIEMSIIQLISNALKFSFNGDAVNVGVSQVKEHLYITVTDHGVGIKEHEKSKIFNAFYQTKASQEQHSPGSGLGLTIVKESVEHLCGTITVEENRPQGCRFIIQIPIPQGVN
ncbi:sensor histidine kinase [Pseudoalteromonas sp. H105]|uniref:sensor histidine kinase n=1 Tax=Pseudoalteromonas sp. H105 TaxID=1348393 RepID=UPI0007322A4E|nr:HAMP domain-containing sensor histidine kinase [Pseudoalteromonas sp. H105]KTF15756.1 histidine kinase [Pseudoalteromonas sp. H105]